MFGCTHFFKILHLLYAISKSICDPWSKSINDVENYQQCNKLRHASVIVTNVSYLVLILIIIIMKELVFRVLIMLLLLLLFIRNITSSNTNIS